MPGGRDHGSWFMLLDHGSCFWIMVHGSWFIAVNIDRPLLLLAKQAIRLNYELYGNPKNDRLWL